MRLRFSEKELGLWASRYAYPGEDRVLDLREEILDAMYMTKEQL